MPALVTIAWIFALTAGQPQHSDIKPHRPAEFANVCQPWDEWDKPAPPFAIFANTYYVGTCGITAIMVASDDGLIVIDGGPRNGGPLIAASIKALGWTMGDVKILLHSHEHFDHAGGLADLHQRSGARVIASKSAAPVLESGESAANDPQAGMADPFDPVPVSQTISDGEAVTLGGVTLTAMETPGHTPGALSWTWSACEADHCKQLVYMDSLSPISNDVYRFSDHPEYVAAYRSGLDRLRTIPCDIALTAHPSSSGMLKRLTTTGSLEDSNRCRDFADGIERRLEQRLTKERDAPRH